MEQKAADLKKCQQRKLRELLVFGFHLKRVF